MASTQEAVRYRFTSKSGSSYELRLGRDGVVYCTCPAWKFGGKKKCKHIMSFEHQSFVNGLVPHDGMVL